MSSRSTYTDEPSNARDAIFSILANRYAKRTGLKVAPSKGAGQAERRARRKNASGTAPYPAPSLNGVASKHYTSRRRDHLTPPPFSDASSVASSSSPRTPPLGYVEEPLIASRQSSVGCDSSLPSLGYQASRVQKGKGGGLFNLPEDMLPLRGELDVIPSTGLCLYDGMETKEYGQFDMFEGTYPLQDFSNAASDEQVDELFGMFLKEGYYGEVTNTS